MLACADSYWMLSGVFAERSMFRLPAIDVRLILDFVSRHCNEVNAWFLSWF